MPTENEIPDPFVEIIPDIPLLNDAHSIRIRTGVDTLDQDRMERIIAKIDSARGLEPRERIVAICSVIYHEGLLR